MHVCKIWHNDLTEYQVWYKLTELLKAFWHFLTVNRNKTLQVDLVTILAVEENFERFSCLEFIFEKSKPRKAGLKHKLKL